MSMHNVDIQQTELGDMVNLTCTVTTCRTMEYSVEILGPSNQTLRRWDGMFDQGPNVFTWNMRVSMENIGQYRCLARAMMNGLTFEEVSMADVSGISMRKTYTQCHVNTAHAGKCMGLKF